ncbi:MAG: hypothetical protein AAB503_01050 [Patescibacteria group bacterium]
MAEIQNFGGAFEKHLGEIKNEVERQKETPELKELPEREIVKQAIKSVVQSEEKSGIIPKSGTGNLPSYITSKNTGVAAQDEVNNLIEIALRDGVIEAVRESRKHPAFVIDAFHDALVDKILPELKRRGIMK